MSSLTVLADRRAIAVVALLAATLFLWNLGGYDVWAPDEPYFAEGAREMLADGHWQVAHINNQVSSDKPPLFFWLIALLSWPFGEVTALTARMPSVLAALGSVLLVMRFARRHIAPEAAPIAGTALATTYMFWDKARSSQIDSLLCILILLALTAFAEFRSGELEGRRAGLVFWTALALAVLAKGPVGLLLPLGIALSTLAADRSLRRWRQFAPISGPLVFVAIAAAWIGALEIWPVDGYSVWGALQEHFVERGVSGMHHKQPPWYYLRVLVYSPFPWSFLLPGGVWLAWKRRRFDTERFLLVWAVFVPFFFSVSTEKRDLYILPAIPAFALLVAALVTVVLRRSSADDPARGYVPTPRALSIPLAVLGTALLGVGLVMPPAALRFDAEMLRPAIATAVSFFAGGALTLLWLRRSRLDLAALSVSLSMAAALLTATTFIYPALNPQKSGRELAGVVSEEARELPADARLLALAIANVIRPINLYSNGIYLEEIETEDFVEAVEAGEELLVVANRKHLPQMADSTLRRATTVYETRLSRMDLVVYRIAAR